jgi:hypothetical protein
MTSIVPGPGLELVIGYDLIFQIRFVSDNKERKSIRLAWRRISQEVAFPFVKIGEANAV